MARILEFDEKLLSAQSALNADSGGYQINFSGNLKFLLEFSSGVTAGAVTLYEAHSKDYAGTWFALATIDFATMVVTANSVYPWTQGTYPYKAIKAKITDAIVGGTVTVYAFGT